MGFGPCAEAGTLVFESLPGARLEVDLVKQMWETASDQNGSRSRILVGSEATEEALKSGLTNPGILHLATHGFFLADSCSEPGNDDTRWRNPLDRLPTRR